MIYTVTFNPSLDYVVQAEQLVPGEINRTTSEAVYPGGKGVNVSVILSNLGLESTAFGFTAGFTGKALQEMLLEFGAKTDFIRLQTGRQGSMSRSTQDRRQRSTDKDQRLQKQRSRSCLRS